MTSLLMTPLTDQDHPPTTMDIDTLKPSFVYIQFERINREKNERRYYYLGWEQTILDKGAVVRRYGRKGGQQRTMAPASYPSLGAAWPNIRAIIRRRLRNGYKIVGPDYSIALSTLTIRS